MAKAQTNPLDGFLSRVKSGAAMKLSEQPDLSVISTGVLTIDAALGVGGWARGFMHMIWGNPSAGKTALCLTTAADLMKRKPDALVAWIDVEKTMRREWAAINGIDLDRFAIMVPDTTEATLQMFQEVLRERIFDLIVIDSLGALTRAVEIDGKATKGKDDGEGSGSTGGAVMGGSSGLISRMVRVGNSELARIEASIARGEDAVLPVPLLVNQVREDVKSTHGAQKFSGGKALHHMLASIVKVTASNAAVDVLMGTDFTGVKKRVGTIVTSDVQKNKLAPSPEMAKYRFVHRKCAEYSFGVDSVRAMVEVAALYNVIEQRGAWFYVGEHKEQGLEATVEWLKTEPEIQRDIRNKVLAIVRSGLPTTTEDGKLIANIQDDSDRSVTE